MGVSGSLYRLVLLLHILTVVVGFGSLISNAAYARLARERGGPEGLAISEANAAVTNRVGRGTFFAVPVFGILLVLLSDGTFGFEEPWVSLSFLLYIAAAVILLVVLIPTQRQVNAAAAGTGAGGVTGSRERLVRKVAAFEGIFNLLFLAVLALMIFKPGS